MTSLSFILVQPGRQASPAAKHQERVGIYSHAQKVTQRWKRERRILERKQKAKAESRNRSTSRDSTPALICDGDIGDNTPSSGSLRPPWFDNAQNLPTPPHESDFDRPLSNYSAWTEDHRYGINMFVHLTIMDINTINTNMQFWTRVVPAYSETWECVRDIVSAIACANEAIQYRNDNLFLIALGLHLRAIRNLRRDLIKLPLSAQVACCMLFEAFSVLQCDFGAVGRQLDTAKMLTKRVSMTTYLEDDNLAIVCDALSKMDQVPTWSLWNPTNFLKYEGLRLTEPRLVLDFEPINLQLGVLDALMENISRLARQVSGRVRRNLSENAFVDPNSAFARDVLDHFRVWRSRFDSLISEGTYDRGCGTVRQAELAWHFTYITFSTGVLGCGEMIYDNPEYYHHFLRINELAAQCFEEAADFTKHASIKAFLHILVPSLWLVILMCRHPSIRSRAIAILKSRHYQESDFDSVLTGLLADHFVDLETCGERIESAAAINRGARIRVEGLKYDEHSQEVALTYRFAKNPASTPIYTRRIPWKPNIDIIKFNSAIDALSQMCTLYRKVDPLCAPSGYIKPMFYKDASVPTLISPSFR